MLNNKFIELTQSIISELNSKFTLNPNYLYTFRIINTIVKNVPGNKIYLILDKNEHNIGRVYIVIESNTGDIYFSTDILTNPKKFSVLNIATNSMFEKYEKNKQTKKVKNTIEQTLRKNKYNSNKLKSLLKKIVIEDIIKNESKNTYKNKNYKIYKKYNTKKIDNMKKTLREKETKYIPINLIEKIQYSETFEEYINRLLKTLLLFGISDENSFKSNFDFIKKKIENSKKDFLREITEIVTYTTF